MKKATFKSTASRIANLEGLSSEVSIGNVREVLSHLSVLMIKDPSVISMLIDNGNKKVAAWGKKFEAAAKKKQ